MTASTRAFLITGLLAQLGAALLHILVLAGAGVWPALIHLTLFGWISAIITAVNYHTMPVFAARDFPAPRLIWLHWACFTSGVALATAGLLEGARLGMIAGLVLQLLAALIFMSNTLLLFLRGPRRAHRAPAPAVRDQPRVDRVGVQATRGAGMCLTAALLLLLAVELNWIDGAWMLAAEHLMTLGWIMLMIVGVAYHTLPRFSGQGVRGAAWARLQLLTQAGALALIVPSLGWGWSRLFAIGGLLMALAIGLFAWTIWPALHVGARRPASLRAMLKERLR